jgi:hypothetical protein
MISVTRLHCELPYFSMVGIADGLTAPILDLLRGNSSAFTASNSERMAKDFSAALGKECKYLPSVYPLGPRRALTVTEGVDDVVCFGRIFSLKNLAAQAVASIRFAKARGRKLRFHVNDFADHGDKAVLQILGMLLSTPDTQLVTHGWMTKTALYAFLATMTVGLQVSFSEASNVMTMDYANVGLPMVVSREIKWATPCSVAYPTDTNDIARRMEIALEFPNLVEENRRNLEIRNHEAIGHWKAFLSPHARVLFLYHRTPNGQETGISNAAMNDSAMLRENGYYADAVATDFSPLSVRRALRTAGSYDHVIYEASFTNLPWTSVL